MQNQTFNIYFDEAWRWPLAGPLFIGLVCPIKILSKREIEVFCDSKKISESKREELFLLIEDLQKKWKILATTSWVTAAEIDKYWVSNALHCSILRWMIKIFNQIFPDDKFKNIFPDPLSKRIKASIKYSDVLNYFSNLASEWININLILDGNRDFGLKKIFPFWNIETIISWDAKIKEIWMASIIAKVSRDRLMSKLPNKYAKYHFENHKWYGTKEHKCLIEKYWPSDIHRKLFLKPIYENYSFEKKLPCKF